MTQKSVYLIVEKVITSLDQSKAAGPDCILVVVLKNCESELWYILAEFSNMSLKESCFPDFWRVLLLLLVFKNVWERSAAKNYCPFSLISVVSKVFEKSFIKYLRQALVSMWNSHYEKSSVSVFQEFFVSIDKIFTLGGRLGSRL